MTSFTKFIYLFNFLHFISLLNFSQFHLPSLLRAIYLFPVIYLLYCVPSTFSIACHLPSLLRAILSRFWLRLASPGPDHLLFRPHTLPTRLNLQTRQPYICGTLTRSGTLKKNFPLILPFHQHHWITMALKTEKEVPKQVWLDLAISEYYEAIAAFEKTSVTLLAKMYGLIPFTLQLRAPIQFE